MGHLYRRSLWHHRVASEGSSKQNGMHKMALAKGKEELIIYKLIKIIKLTIDPYEIMVLINQAWVQSLPRSRTNKIIIANRGWYPLNRNLLLNMTIRVTMADNDKNKESERISVPTMLLPTPTFTAFTAPVIAHATSTALVNPTIATALVTHAATNTPQFDSSYIVCPNPDREMMN